VLAARAHLARLDLTANLHCADALALPYQNASFDHVWLMWFLEHVSDPVAALREARRVLVGDGALTAIEVDYNSTSATPTSNAIETLFAAVAAAMERNGRSDVGTRLEGWLIEAGFGSSDPHERRLLYTGPGLARQLPYVIALVESTLAELASASDATEAQLRAGSRISAHSARHQAHHSAGQCTRRTRGRRHSRRCNRPAPHPAHNLRHGDTDRGGAAAGPRRLPPASAGGGGRDARSPCCG
jgi:SAM-dependent methyltransferase